MRTVLLATDGSASAAKATRLAIELAGAFRGALHVVSVWRTPTFEYGYVPVTYTPELVHAERGRAADVLAKAVAAADDAGVSTTSELREGDPRDEILDAAEETAADMIVIGAHGRSSMGRLLFGSVSTSVLHHASCPVLVVRGDEVVEEPEAVGLATTRSDG
jgi:nucleotide-binding universal stress UspA family protein